MRQIEKMAKEKRPSARRAAAKSPDIRSLEEELKDLFGTKVNLNQRGKGKIEIEFYSREELDRLIELLKTLG